MKAWIKAAIGVALSFMCFFTAIGYAKLTTELTVKGSADIAPPDAIFIYDITNVTTSNATFITSPTSVDFPSAKILSEITFASKNASVNFDVTVVNGTGVDQIFNELKELTSASDDFAGLSYANIDWSVTPGQATVVPSGQTVIFNVTLTYSGSGTNQTRKMLHNFDFVLNSDDLTEAASKGVTEKFKDILNSALEEDVTYVYDGEEITVKKEDTYNTLVDNMETSYSGKYIGNLDGADGDDKALLTALFEGELTFPVGDTDVPVTVMAKEMDVYGDSGKEMIIFITADDLTSTWKYVPVYVSVFTQYADGNWNQVGGIFAGEARTCTYSGWYGSGSFNTDTWRSTEVYYNLASGNSISSIMDAYGEQ